MSQAPARHAIDALLAALDRRLALTLDALLHHPAVQRLVPWRALHRLVAPLHPHDNIQIDLLPLRRCGFEHNLCHREPEHGGLHHLVHKPRHASHGGRPYGLLCAASTSAPTPPTSPSCAAAPPWPPAPTCPSSRARPGPPRRPLAHANPQLRDLHTGPVGPRSPPGTSSRAAPERPPPHPLPATLLLRPPHDSDRTPSTLHHRESLSDPEHRL